MAPSHSDAASSNVVPSGIVANGLLARMHMYSACAPKRPELTPNTRSPTANSVTSSPTSSTTPASSLPRMRHFGRSNPVKYRAMNGSADRNPQSERLTVVATTRMSTSSGLGLGRSTSSRWSTSGPPYRSCVIAFISITSVSVVVGDVGSVRRVSMPGRP